MVSPGRIRILPRQLANQIAAGEVVERPASVVKELVENSLDAGARRIEVEVEQGGARVIRVRDDGHGMSREELSLALARHATSKIRSLDDLQRVQSLGFRGEALPSIASVSRLELAAAVEGEEGGWCLRVAGGEGVDAPAPMPHGPGTTVTVRDLFYNTPARRKFLRTERTEFRHLEDVIKRAALSRFDTAFSLHHNARQVFALVRAGDERLRARRVARLCGGEFVERALAIDFDATGLRLSGWIGAADYSRASTDLQNFFVNGRMVLDPMLRHAVRQACHERVPPGRHPAYVLYLELDPVQVDVNVHPTKHEVRFRDARSVHDFVVHSLRRALAQIPIPADSGAPAPGRGSDSTRRSSISAPDPARRYAGSRADGSLYRSLAEAGAPAPGMAEPMVELGVELGVESKGDPAADAVGKPLGQALARVAGRYLLARAGEELVLVDLSAARGELARRRMLATFEAGSPASRPLLVPVTVDVGEAAADQLEGAASLLERLGFDLRRIAPGSMSVRQLPASLAACSPGDVLPALARALAPLDGAPADGDADIARRLVDGVLSRVDLGHSVPWDVAEMDALLRALETMETDPGYTPAAALWTRVSAGDLAALLARAPAS